MKEHFFKRISLSVLIIGCTFISSESVFAACCFKPPKHGEKFTCESILRQKECGESGGVAYRNSGTCSGNPKITCCYGKGDSSIVKHLRNGLIEIKNQHPPGLCENSVQLPIDIINFTAALEEGGVHLNLTMTELDSAGVNIWRIQIDQSGFKDPEKINPGLISGHANPFEEVHFSLLDENPLPGINYYVIQDIATSGDSTIHCDFMQSVIVGDESLGTDLERAKSLCNEYTNKILILVSKPE